MKRLAALAPFLSLLLPLLVTGCATKRVTVPIEYAAEYMIMNHNGVAAWPTENGVTNERGPDVAEELSAAMREALSADGNRFNLVSLDEQAEIGDYLEQKGQSFDDIDPSAIEDFSNLFGHEIPATAWITGRLVKLTIHDPKPAPGHLIEGPLSGLTPNDAMVREGRVEIGWEVSLIEVGKRTKPISKVLKAQADERQVAGLEEVPAEIDFPRLINECVADLHTQFELLFTNSTQYESIEIFIGDGIMHMPWEGGEFPELTAGFERMSNEDYTYAREQYESLVERLKPHGGEMLARAYYNLGFCYEAQGDFELAMEQYEEAVRISTNTTISAGRTRCKRRIEDRDAVQAEVEKRIEA